MEDIVLYYSCKYFGDWERIYDALEEQEDIDFEQLEMYKEHYEGQYVTVYSREYPSELRQTRRPPFVIFYKGDKRLLKSENKIWIFGSYYEEQTDELLQEQMKELVKEGFTIVSGLTTKFERSFVKNHTLSNSIIVKDSGINSNVNLTKAEEKKLLKDNLIVSEYPDKVFPSLYTWEVSTKVKAGLSEKIYLINSEKEPVTFKVISDTIDEKREVFCYAKDVTKDSHNTILISKGAYAINKIKELKN